MRWYSDNKSVFSLPMWLLA